MYEQSWHCRSYKHPSVDTVCTAYCSPQHYRCHVNSLLRCHIDISLHDNRYILWLQVSHHTLTLIVHLLIELSLLVSAHRYVYGMVYLYIWSGVFPFHIWKVNIIMVGTRAFGLHYSWAPRHSPCKQENLLHENPKRVTYKHEETFFFLLSHLLILWSVKLVGAVGARIDVRSS